MHDRLPAFPDDPILRLIGLFRDDPRAAKLDLGVGVYRNEAGQTPVMGAIRQAAARVLAAETTKSYLGLGGDPVFCRALSELALGPSVPASRIAAIATPGGTGAVRQGCELLRLLAPQATVWVPSPTWPNHLSILDHLGLRRAAYRYYDPATGGIDAAALLEDLGRAEPGDMVLIHGCCHNPTGADPDPDLWQSLAVLVADRGLIPFIDLAYQGWGAGLEHDARGLRLLAATCPETLVAVSCSKSFGVYRDRAGALLAIGPEDGTPARQRALEHLNRQAYSFPPDHGARLVTTVLTDADLRRDWAAELETARQRIATIRTALGAALRQRTGSARFDALGRQRGMFSLLPLGPAQMTALREDHAVYAVGDGRINLAGLTTATVPVLADAIAAVAA